MIFKGGILHSWGKKQAIALHSGFYKTLPKLPEVKPDKADIAWLIYDLQLEATRHRYNLTLSDTVYTAFKPALDRITVPEPGPTDSFIEHLQSKLDEKLDDGNPPDEPTLNDLLES